jgi:hypothetical protein
MTIDNFQVTLKDSTLADMGYYEYNPIFAAKIPLSNILLSMGFVPKIGSFCRHLPLCIVPVLLVVLSISF